MPELKSKEVDGVLVVGFTSSKLLDESVIQKVGEELTGKVTEAAEGDSKKILLTFHHVSFMSSSMLGKLVMFLKQCRKQDVELKVCSIPPEIFQVFKITKLHKTFDVYKDEQKALASFTKKSWFG